ncbi:restriction endonuclease subunit S [Metabacillus fastidiosus]|uniref:restriction endonuclease subunit S n=1 Tax=Metabacillus fastidiosus TaxID=1458 RepID=UPI002DB8AAA5|nr:restriction endonuclease subunit S [Metabacillus fastidiosus]MEC2074812.1 restriction endonuclease subunit S [Metabacillus fastidiosus]
MSSKVKLADLTLKIGSGSTPKGGKAAYLDSGIFKLIRSQNVYNHHFSKDGLAYISETQAQKLQNVELKKNDILINITGDSVARTTIVTDEMLPGRVNQHVSIIRCNEEKLNPYFLLAILTSNDMQRYLLSLAQVGGTRAALTKGMLENLEIDLLNKNQQEFVHQILSSVNSKIKVNQRIIKLLEEISQTLFKRWFIDFEFLNEQGLPYKSSGGKMMDSNLGEIPKDWRISKVGNECKIIRGASPRPIQEFMASEGRPWVKISDANASISCFIQGTKEFIIEAGIKKSRTVEPGTLILSNSATPGIPKFMDVLASVHDGWLIFNEYQSVSKEFMYLYLLHEREAILSMSNGSVFRNLKTDILKNYKLVVPCEEVLNTFQKLVEPIFEQIRTLSDEIIKLSDIRNTLLPKLLSGEIEIPDESVVD